MKTIGTGKYLLYTEVLYNCGNYKEGQKSIGRRFNTIKEAIAATDINIANCCIWRLIRTTDNKNLTKKIYPDW